MSNRVNEKSANKVENIKENVILLSMSTLPQTIKPNKFEYLEGEEKDHFGENLSLLRIPKPFYPSLIRKEKELIELSF